MNSDRSSKNPSNDDKGPGLKRAAIGPDGIIQADEPSSASAIIPPAIPGSGGIEGRILSRPQRLAGGLRRSGRCRRGGRDPRIPHLPGPDKPLMGRGSPKVQNL